MCTIVCDRHPESLKDTHMSVSCESRKEARKIYVLSAKTKTRMLKLAMTMQAMREIWVRKGAAA